MSARRTSSKAKTTKAEETEVKEAEVEETKEEAAEAVTEPVEEAAESAPRVFKATAAAAEAEAEAEQAEPVAYIGPDIKFIAKRGTIYTNGLPKALSKKIEEVPTISGLLVPVSRLSAAMQAVTKEGTSLNNLFMAVAEKTK